MVDIIRIDISCALYQTEDCMTSYKLIEIFMVALKW